MSEQIRAYQAGLQDGRMGVRISDINPSWVQDANNWEDETVVSYLNGVGDGRAGL